MPRKVSIARTVWHFTLVQAHAARVMETVGRIDWRLQSLLETERSRATVVRAKVRASCVIDRVNLHDCTGNRCHLKQTACARMLNTIPRRSIEHVGFRAAPHGAPVVFAVSTTRVCVSALARMALLFVLREALMNTQAHDTAMHDAIPVLEGPFMAIRDHAPVRRAHHRVDGTWRDLVLEQAASTAVTLTVLMVPEMRAHAAIAIIVHVPTHVQIAKHRCM